MFDIDSEKMLVGLEYFLKYFLQIVSHVFLPRRNEFVVRADDAFPPYANIKELEINNAHARKSERKTSEVNESRWNEFKWDQLV